MDPPAVDYKLLEDRKLDVARSSWQNKEDAIDLFGEDYAKKTTPAIIIKAKFTKAGAPLFDFYFEELNTTFTNYSIDYIWKYCEEVPVQMLKLRSEYLKNGDKAQKIRTNALKNSLKASKRNNEVKKSSKRKARKSLTLNDERAKKKQNQNPQAAVIEVLDDDLSEEKLEEEKKKKADFLQRFNTCIHGNSNTPKLQKDEGKEAVRKIVPG